MRGPDGSWLFSCSGSRSKVVSQAIAESLGGSFAFAAPTCGNATGRSRARPNKGLESKGQRHANRAVHLAWTHTLPDLVTLMSRLSALSMDESAALGLVAVDILDVNGKGIYMTRELVQALRPLQEVLVKC